MLLTIVFLIISARPLKRAKITYPLCLVSPKCVHITYPTRTTKHLKKLHVIAKKRTNPKSTLYQTHSHTKHSFIVTLPHSFLENKTIRPEISHAEKNHHPPCHIPKMYTVSWPPSMFVIYNPSMMIYVYLTAISCSLDYYLSFIILAIIVVITAATTWKKRIVRVFQ